MTRAVRLVATVLLGTLVVTACSDPPAERVTPAGGVAPTSAASGARTPGATPGGTPATGVPAVVVLPESDLPELDGYTYASAPGVPVAVAGLDAGFVSGYIGRAVLRGRDRAGIVQLVRLRRTTAATDFAEAFIQQYAQTSDFDGERLAGQRVRTTSLLRGRPGGLVTWVDGRDLVLVYAEGGVSAARRLARAYLQAG
jgi:hypothetical protein